MQKNGKERVIEVCVSPFRGTEGGMSAQSPLVVTVLTDTIPQMGQSKNKVFIKENVAG